MMGQNPKELPVFFLSKAQEIDLQGITVKIQYLANAKGLRLRIDRVHRQPVVSAPSHASVRKIQAFVQTNEEWILNELEALKPKSLPKILEIHGIPYEIGVTFRPGRAHLQWDENSHQITYLGPEERFVPLFIRHLGHRARDVAMTYSQEYAESLGVSFQTLKIGEYKSRWGACGHNGDLSYSWRLILAPPKIFAYVCAHEVAHLIHPNHSRAFWKTVNTLDPHCDSHRQWLKLHNRRLYAII